MPHIHTEHGQHDHTVTAYIVRTDTSEPRVLLHMHKKLAKLMPIGGHVELDETPWQSIAHELSEESGYELYDLRLLQPKDSVRSLEHTVIHPYPVVMNTHNFFDDNPGEHFHSDTAYAFVAGAGPSHGVAEGESADLRWLSGEELDDLEPSMIFENNRQIYRFILNTALTAWDTVATTDFHR